MPNFDPRNISDDDMQKYVVPSAEEVRRQRVEKLRKEGVRTRCVDEATSIDDAMDIADGISRDSGDNVIEYAKPLQKDVDYDNISSVVEKVITKPRIRVKFELEGGSYTVPAIDVKECAYGIMVLMPNGIDDVTFMPSPGTEITVKWRDKEVVCFSPGASFDFDELDSVGVVLIKSGI